MSKIRDYPGGYSPIFSFGPDKFSGPTEYRVVALHNNTPPSSACKMPKNHIAQGRCWVVMSGWRPLPTDR
jgi:hypothetical protein